MRFCGTWSIACSRPPTPWPVPVQTQASFWARVDKKMRIHQPQPPGRSLAFLIPYPPFCFRGWIAGKAASWGALPLTGPSRRPVGLPSAQQAENTGVSAALCFSMEQKLHVRRGEPRPVATAPTQHSAHKTSRVPSSQLQVNGQTIKHTAQKLSPKDLTLFRRTWGKFKLKGGLENSTNLVVNN